MEHAQQFYIDGRWVEPSGHRRLEVVNPATEQPIATIALGDQADIDRAVGAARRAFPRYSESALKERVALLEAVLTTYKKRWKDIAACVTAEVGAPVKLAEGAQTGAGYHHFQVTLAALKSFTFEEKVGNSILLREPIGVCGLITPWNWPLNQIAAKVAPALACGCTVVLKPSEVAPLNAIVVAEVLHEAGVPAGVFNLVNGDGPTTGAALAAHPDVDLVSFTGSTAGGIAVAKAAADTVKRVAQELGGKSPNILLDDADFEAAVARDVLTMMNNSGQSCNAPSRMLVPAHRLADVERIARATAESLAVDDPTKVGTAVGPVVSQRQWMRVQRLINTGIEEGGKLLTGGPGRPEGLDTGYFVRPTIFTAVDRTNTIAREEIFGPVLAIMTYRDEDEAVEIANDTAYGLSAWVSSKDVAHANRIARRLRAGNVHINGQWGSEPMPFGGYKQSGNGREGGVFGFQEFLETKAILAGG